MIVENISKQFNVSHYLIEEQNINQGREDKVGIYFKDETYTYGEIARKANQYANYLIENGVKREEKIALYMHDSPDFIFLVLGAIRAGIVPAIINPKMQLEDVNGIIQRTDVNLLFTNQELHEKVNNSNIKAQNIDLKEVKNELASFSESFETVDTMKEDTAFMLFTSGSSGVPKGAVHRHCNIAVVVETFGKHIYDMQEDDVFYSHSKLPFAFGLGQMYLPFAYGASVVINDDDSLYDIFDLVEKYKVTKFQAVPTVYASMSALFPADKNPFETCKVFVSSGEALPKNIALAWKEKAGKDIFQGFGSTELLNIAVCNNKDAIRYGSLGKAVNGYEVQIVDDDNNVVEPNVIGNMIIKGESVMTEYWKNSEQTSETLIEGGLRTGDMCYYDEDGFIWYSGRNSDIFKVNGVWQSALPIEEVILMEEHITEAVVVNEADTNNETQIVAYVVTEAIDTCEDTIKELRNLFFKKQMRNLCPKKFYFVEAIPRGTTGKINRRAVNTANVLKEL